MWSSRNAESEEEVSDGLLCVYCRGINMSDLECPLGYKHQSTYTDLLQSLRSCNLCALISAAVEKTLQRWPQFSYHINGSSGPVRLVARQHDGKSKKQNKRGGNTASSHSSQGQLAIIIGEFVERSHAFSDFGAKMDMFAMKEVEASQAEIIGAMHLIERFARSQRNMDCLRGLLRRCHLQHGLCSLGIIEKLGRKYYERYGSFGQPKRLIDVTMHDSSKVRVIEVEGSPEYTTLSYCWGSNNQFSTTKDNLSRMEQGIEISRLCPAIQDAIFITRNLHVRFLWVDALCIIQEGDGGKDWREQAQIMGLIYARSYVTLAAASTVDCSKSFLDEPRRPAFVKTPFREEPQSPEVGSILFRIPKFDFAEDFEENVYGSALAKRAWVMQERMFSPRTIHFTSTQIYWECRSLFWAENGEATEAFGYEGFRRAPALLDSIFIALETCTAEADSPFKKDYGIFLFLRAWSDVVKEYSTTDLTYSSDRLPAIAGLANLASSVVPGAYLSGLWECDLANGLLWTAQEYPMAWPSTKSAPSWSWASSVSPVRMHCRQFMDRCDSRIFFQQVSLGHDGMEILEVQGKLHECSVSQQAEPQHRPRKLKEQMMEDGSPPYRFWPVGLEEDMGNESNICHFDRNEEMSARLFFFPLACSGHKIRHCQGLLLKEDTSSLGAYKRCGIGWASHSVWHNVSPSLVKIA